MTPASSAIISASSDTDLTARIIAVAATLGCVTPEYDAQKYRRELVIAPVDESGATVAAVYEYACMARAQAIAAREAAVRAAEDAHPIPPDPGANPAAVTDTHLAAAIMHLISMGKISAQESA